MSDVTFEIIFIFVLPIANGVFSMSETAIVSARKARLQHWANEGSTSAQADLELANSPGSFLSTVQIGITLVGILTGTFGGATITEKISPSLMRTSWLAPYVDTVSFGLVVAVITYLSLVIGALIPKRVALRSPDKIASLVASVRIENSIRRILGKADLQAYC